MKIDNEKGKLAQCDSDPIFDFLRFFLDSFTTYQSSYIKNQISSTLIEFLSMFPMNSHYF